MRVDLSSPDDLATLRARAAAERHAVRRDRCRAVLLAAEFGRPLKLSAVYALMHRVGLSCLRPRPRHRKNDPAAMAAWLERAPFLSTR